jgi:hypothetical protein
MSVHVTANVTDYLDGTRIFELVHFDERPGSRIAIDRYANMLDIPDRFAEPLAILLNTRETAVPGVGVLFYEFIPEDEYPTFFDDMPDHNNAGGVVRFRKFQFDARAIA